MISSRAPRGRTESSCSRSRRAPICTCARIVFLVDWEVLETSSAVLQTAAIPSQLPVRERRCNECYNGVMFETNSRLQKIHDLVGQSLLAENHADLSCRSNFLKHFQFSQSHQRRILS